MKLHLYLPLLPRGGKHPGLWIWSFAPAPGTWHASSSNCWKPCCGDEIHAFSLPSGTARDTDLKPVFFFSHGDICHCSKPTCLISPLVYVVSDQVFSNSSCTWHSNCRCLPFKALKTITKTITAFFLPDSSPEGNYFQTINQHNGCWHQCWTSTAGQAKLAPAPRPTLSSIAAVHGKADASPSPASPPGTHPCTWRGGEGEREADDFLSLLPCPLLTVGWALLEASGRAAPPQTLGVVPLLRPSGRALRASQGGKENLPAHFWLGKIYSLQRWWCFVLALGGTNCTSTVQPGLVTSDAMCCPAHIPGWSSQEGTY